MRNDALIPRTDRADETIIEFDRRKLIYFIILSAIFMVGGVWMLFLVEVNPRDPVVFFRYPIVVRGGGLCCLVVFGYSAVFCFRRLLDKRPALILNVSGLTDMSSALSPGVVPWRDILGFETKSFFGSTVLVVRLIDPNRYANAGNPLLRILKRTNMMAGSPIVINPNALKISFADLAEKCNWWFEKHQTLA